MQSTCFLKEMIQFLQLNLIYSTTEHISGYYEREKINGASNFS